MSNSLRNLEYSELKELVLFLKQDDSEFYIILKRLERFFPTLKASQALVLGNIIGYILSDDNKTAEETFNQFKSENLDLEIDPDGKSEVKNLDYSTVALDSVEIAYNAAKNNLDNASIQIQNAKTLECLDSIPDENYLMKRVLYYKRDNEKPVSLDELKLADAEMKELVKEDANRVMSKVLNYIYNKDADECKYFIEHFLIRLHACYMDKKLSREENKDFLWRLKAL